ncbi:MAG: 1-acyl-sn-glycerol-3-phosphate acyltransferase [Desulfovibrio sp.]|jgi:1-acyl-sn-glycerol-3-phosphate acyltransferase|nr:1-acyl-sn-glycerol-3-phosphate acyltransferase [Desulfovibrio sp.]
MRISSPACPPAAIPFAADAYATPPDAATAWGRRFPSLVFRLKILSIIRDAGGRAACAPYSGEMWARDSLRVLRALEESGCSLRVEGLDNMDRAPGPCVFIGNHMSTLETFVLPALIQPRREVTFVVKQSLLRTPWFRFVLQSRRPIAVSRDNARRDLAAVLEGGQDRLARGISLIIFPQSTRSFRLDPEQFNSIGVKLARKAGVPVIPVALRTDAWAAGLLWFKDFGPLRPERTIRFRFGAPLAVGGTGKAEQARVYAFIESCLREWEEPAA